MKVYTTNKIRNLALVGHSGSGKTSLTEALLFKTGVTTRLGKVEEGNTVSDFDKEEIARGVSIGISIVPVEWQDTKVNFIDTPGYFDFSGEVYSGLRASEAALVVVDAAAGIEVGTEKVLSYTESIALPRIIFVNKMDKENIAFDLLVDKLQNKYGKKIIPFTLTLEDDGVFKGIIDVVNKKAYKYDGNKAEEFSIPADKMDEVNSIYNQIVEVVAETDDDLMEKYFTGETFNHEEFMKGITTALLDGRVVPLVAGSVTKDIGLDVLMDIVLDYMPSPDYEGAKYGFRHDELPDVIRKVDVNEPYCAVIFKTIVDPFVGKISIFKVISGKIKKDIEFYNSTKKKIEKMGGLFYLRGKNQIDTSEVVAGDIGAFSKLTFSQTGDTLSDKKSPMVFKPLKYPTPTLYIAVEAVKKDDEEKITTSLQKLQEADPSFIVERHPETKQLRLGGQGDVQLQVILNKLKNTFELEAKTIPLRIAYRETIKGKSDVQGKHKKQSGGAGQYGDVHIRFEHSDKDFEFTEEIFGGSVPRNFIPAVEKGLKECLEKGVLAGYPVVNIKAILYDGSYHSVDSNEMAFRMAAHLAFRKGIEEASPILLEPIMKVEIQVPDDYAGDIMGEINKRRGRILGMEPLEEGQLIVAEAPHGEMFDFAVDLRSMTQARGSFNMAFIRYEEAPPHISTKIIEDSKKAKNLNINVEKNNKEQ